MLITIWFIWLDLNVKYFSINYVEERDEGQYICTAENEAGYQSATAYIYVRGKIKTFDLVV